MGRKKKDPGAGLMAEARAADAKRLAAIEGVSLPDAELQEERLRLAAEQIPELAGLLEAEQLDQVDDLEFDPRLKEAQMAALESMQERGKSGLSEEDKLIYDDIRESLASDAASQQADIGRRMAEQGASGSGQEMAQRMNAQQVAAMQASKAGRGMAADALRSKMESEQTAGQMSGQMSAQDMARQQSNRAAQQQIAQFNAQNRQQTNRYNLGQQQNIANQTANQRNQMYTNLVDQQNQQFQNELNRANAVAGVHGQQAGGLRSQATQARQNQGPSGFGSFVQGAGTGAATGAAVGGPWGAAIGAGVGGLATMFADGGIVSPSIDVDAERAAFAGSPLSPEEVAQVQDINSQIRAEQNNIHYPEEEGKDYSYAEREAFERALDAQQNAYADGGVPGYVEEDGTNVSIDGGFISNGMEDEYAGDRIDAKLNKGEMVINGEQQQRVLDVIRGEASPEILHNGEDIIETPEAAQNRGFLKILEMIGNK